MKRAMLVIYGPSDGTEMLRLVGALVHGGRYRPIVYFFANYRVLAERIDLSVLRDVQCFDHAGNEIHFSDSVASEANNAAASSAPTPPEILPPSEISFARRALRTLPEWAKTPLRAALAGASTLWRRRFRFSIALGLFGEILRLRAEVATCRRLLTRISPDVLILPLEAVGNHSASFAFAAHGLGMPKVLVPYTVPVNVGEIGERWYYDRRYWVVGIVNRMIAARFPEWVHEYRGRNLLRLRPVEILALTWMKMAPKRPWDAGGMQYMDLIAIESERMREFYVQENYPVDRLKVVGSLVDDLLYARRVDRSRHLADLYTALNLPLGRPLAVCAIAPDFTDREVSEFHDYDQVIEAWTQGLGRLEKFNVVARPHPSHPIEQFRAMESVGIRVTNMDTALLAPLADVFVASASATIRWAVACGIPVVNYDTYRLAFEEFTGVPGIVTPTTIAEFDEIMRQINADPVMLADLAARQRQVMTRWGRVDGEFVARLHEVLDTVTTRPGC